MANNLHQEVEREDIHNGHSKDRRIREIDDRAKIGCYTDDDKNAEDERQSIYC